MTRPKSKLERILVATDFGPHSETVLEAAATVARMVGAKVHVLCVLEALMYSPPEMGKWAAREPDTHPEATRKLGEAIRFVQTRGVSDVDGSLDFGVPVDVLLKRANEGNFDLLVMGSNSPDGSAEYLVSRSKIPVMAVPA